MHDPMKSPIQRRFSLVMACSFALLLSLPMLDWALRLDRSPQLVENRRPTPRPALSLAAASILAYPGQYDRYFNDHFGFRNLLVRLHGMERVNLTGSGYDGRVIIGKEGWLFVNAGGGLLDTYRGAKPFSADELVRYQLGLEERAGWLARRGIKYVFFIAPDSYDVYPEYLPDRVRRAGGRERVDQLIDFLEAQTDLSIVDLRRTLRDAKQAGRLYHKTDTHWNELGAYFAYSQVQAEIARLLPASGAPSSLADFDTSVSLTQGKDLARNLGLQDKFMEEEIALRQRWPRLAARSQDAPLPSRFPPPYRIPFAYEVADASRPKALMLHDSFAEALAPFMSEHFRRIAYYWMMPMDLAVIEHEKPDIVIQEIVGRVASENILSNPREFVDPKFNPLRKFLSGKTELPPEALEKKAPPKPADRPFVAACSYPAAPNGAVAHRKGRDFYAYGWIATNTDLNIAAEFNGSARPLRYELRKDVETKLPGHRYHVGWVLRIPGELVRDENKLEILVDGQSALALAVHAR
ncbi:MAG: hypothetical protein ABFD69_12640 [Candidatus Sumerlaeia bacterium]